MDTIIAENQICVVETQEDLAQAADWMKNASEVAVDTESDSLFVYYEKVCLIQFTANSKNFIIDPLVVGDLSILAPIFASEKIQKVFHAAEYDLMCLKRDYHFEFHNLFDTMVAARILGRKEIGLGALIENEFDIHLIKKYQKANWGLRPISDEMLLYATMDTNYLCRLKAHLQEELESKNLYPLASEDFQRLCKVPSAISEPEKINWWKIAGKTELPFEQAAVLQSLCELREQAAKKRDLPPFKVVNNLVLLQIAEILPETEENLQKIDGIPVGFVHRYGKIVLSIVKNRKRTRSIPHPSNPARPSNGMLHRKDQLRLWRKQKGIELDVPSDVILPKDILDFISVENPANSTELKSIMAGCPWRFAHFSDEILRAIGE